jgi:hypothetical protein
MMAGRGMDARRSGGDQFDLRAKADQIAAIAETRATIARLSQRRVAGRGIEHTREHTIRRA